MLESIFDLFSLSAVYSIYAGLLLALLHFVWICNVEYEFFSSKQTDTKKRLLIIRPSNRINHTAFNTIIVWIMHHIRGKVSFSDDEDHIVYLLTMTK
jgi:hypothetical protein